MKKLILICIVASLINVTQARAGWEVKQITDNNTADYGPSLYDGKIAWTGRVPGTKMEIFFYDGTEINQITHNGFKDKRPSLNNGQIAWRGEVNPGSDIGRFEIFFYDGTSVIQITDNSDRYYKSESYGFPTINNGQIAWREWDEPDSEIFFWDGTWNESDANIINVSNNGVPDWTASVYDGKVAWKGFCPDDPSRMGIYLWDGENINTIFEDDYVRNHFIGVPTLFKDTVAFSMWDGHDREIYLWENDELIQVTDNSYNDDGYPPALYDGKIAYTGWDGNDQEIFYWDGEQIIQITDNEWDDKYPSLYGNQIAWMGREHIGGDSEIFLATHVVPVPNCDFDLDGDVDGSDLAFFATEDTGVSLELFSTAFGS